MGASGDETRARKSKKGGNKLMTAKVRADLILRQISKRHVGKTHAIDDVFLTEVKNGKTWDNREPLKRYEHDINTLRSIQQIAINAGCNFWNARDGELVLFFEKLVKQGITYNPNIEALISDLEKAVERLKRSIKLESKVG
ncbi:MAG: hypothetical protein QHH75_11950 [Bacillota bacterium]|nr:hypothetical protein [Bacillota bacterium]